MTLSKSQYVRGLQCPKSLWLYKNRPELRSEPDARAEALIEAGYQVGDLARELFPGGVEIAFDPNDFEGMIRRTRKLIDEGAKVIYEAAFKARGIFAMADILVKDKTGWKMYEVKASTQVKPYQIDDAAIQWYALSQTIDLKSAHIVHINNRYIRNGALDLTRLFAIEDVTQAVLAKQEEIPHKLKELQTVLQSDEPNIDIGPHCFDPFECDFRDHCWAHVPKTGSVFELSYAGGKQWKLYREGIVRIEDIPENYPLGANASLQVAHHKSQTVKIDPQKIAQFLRTVHYPINFFDFETYQEAIPRFDGQRPYQQMPFQFSLHILREDGTLEHREFLADERSDPRCEVARRMLEALTPEGSIVAYNQSFEIAQIKNLAEACPKYRERLLALIGRFVDLAVPFQNKSYYHPDFGGRYSIKVVLPTLFPNDPELDYAKLGSVQNGQEAMETFANLHRLKDPAKKEAIRNDLLAYCRLDTLAMVKIWQKLHTLAKTGF
jgi:hypothetical protein